MITTDPRPPRIISQLVSVVLLLLSWASAAGQPLSLPFDHITLEQGLSQSTVNAIVQDGPGFLWFGTQDGLNRFDGYTVRVFRHSDADSSSISDNGIWTMCRDASGNLWIGTMRGGLDCYLVAEDRFLHYRHRADDSTSLSEDNVTAVFADSRGALWAGTISGMLNRIDPVSGTARRIQIRPGSEQASGENTIWMIREDFSGNLWIATWGGLLCLRDGDPSNAITTPVLALGYTNVRTLLVDRRGILWIGTWGGGLAAYDTERGVVQHVRHATDTPATLSSNQILSLAEDAAGSIWVGTGDAGLNELDPLSGRVRRYRHDPYLPSSLNNDIVSAVFEDRGGGLWVGTGAGGVNLYHPLKNRFTLYRDNQADPNDLDGNDVWALCEDTGGDLWIGTYGNGLNRLQRSTGKFYHYRFHPGTPHSLSHNNVIALASGKDGVMWVGTEGGGVCRFTPATGTFRRFMHSRQDPLSISQNEITALLVDSDGLVWIGTNGSGLDRLDPRDGRCAHFPPDTTGRSVSAGSIMALYEDAARNIWIGTWGGGLNKYDRKTKSFTTFDQPGDAAQKSNTTLAIYEDREGILWLGTYGGGLTQFDPRNRTGRQYTEADGLPNNVIYGILPDHRGNLWLTTNRGLARFSPATGTSKNYDINDGLQGNEFNQGSHYRSASGELYFGGNNGFNVVLPDSVRDNPLPPPVYLTSFRVFDRPVRFPRALTEVHEINLLHAQNFFSFEFVALNFCAPQKNRYAYRLDGFDEEWIAAGTRRYASYTNLDPGTYALHVIASNNDGIWNTEGAVVTIIIAPPLWKTWWFQVLIGCAIAALLFVLYRLRVNKLLALERLRTSIASDLHDDIGSTLTEIALYSDLGMRQLKGGRSSRRGEEKMESLLNEIGTMARGLVDAMSDIVWAIDPKNDSFEFLLLRMKSHAVKVLEAKGVAHEVTIAPGLEHLRLPLPFRRGLYLIFKEALNNVVKHAGARQVAITFTRERHDIVLSIIDDGRGFDVGRQTGGNGLQNMRMRGFALHGTLTVDSAKGKGTTISLRARIS